MRAVARRLYSSGLRVFTLSLHSPSLEVGNTPYVRSPEDLRALQGSVSDFLDFSDWKWAGSSRPPPRSTRVSPPCAAVPDGSGDRAALPAAAHGCRDQPPDTSRKNPCLRRDLPPPSVIILGLADCARLFLSSGARCHPRGAFRRRLDP